MSIFHLLISPHGEIVMINKACPLTLGLSTPCKGHTKYPDNTLYTFIDNVASNRINGDLKI